MYKDDSVYSALKRHSMPLTPSEIVAYVNKSKGSIFREIKGLMERGMIEKIKFQYDEQSRNYRIMYKIKKN